MSDLIEIKAKSKTGQVVTFQVSEILEIDGREYQPADHTERILALLSQLDGRLTAVENQSANKDQVHG